VSQPMLENPTRVRNSCRLFLSEKIDRHTVCSSGAFICLLSSRHSHASSSRSPKLTMAQGQSVNITTLPLERLGPIKQQLDEELERLGASLQQLQMALDRYAASKDSLSIVNNANKGAPPSPLDR